ncbi:MAG TPA: hemolysin family protein [Gemmatimonadales bacterium]|nr:hemolysin family protein [Gemmatimonadales bacterium]
MIWPLVILGLLLTIFGATAAAALVTSSRATLAEVVARRLRGGNDSLAWLSPLERDLAAASVTTTLGITLLGAIFPSMFAGATLPRLGLLLILLAIPAILLSGYVLPRFLTHRRAARVATRVRPVLRPWSALLTPLLPAPSLHPEAHITGLWRERAEGGTGLDDALLRVGGVISFSQRSVREVMTPRTDLVAIPEESSVEEVRAAFVQSGYSRLPIYRGTLDEMVGMVHAFDLFRLDPGDPVPVRPLAVAPASRLCGDVLVDMQRERRHLALVLDEFGGTLGIVTLEDLLEAMVGEIVDEDEPAPAPAEDPGLLEVDGSAPVSQLEERFGLAFPQGQASTVGGRLVELAGRFPASGERFLIRGLELDVLHASTTRVERLLIRRGSPGTTALDKPAP